MRNPNTGAGERRTAIVLLSGGLDSTVTAAIALAEGYALHALSIDYGQRHRIEEEAARSIAEKAGVPFTLLNLDLLKQITHNSLTDQAMDQVRNEFRGYTRSTTASRQKIRKSDSRNQ